jgi:hypothetical protein
MSIPDYISPIVGYHGWTWDTKGLKSLCGERWHPNQSLAARCRASAVVGTIAGRVEGHDSHEAPQAKCTCGVYAAKSLEHLRKNGYDRCGIYGEVCLWGAVVEHERGWRAQLAYPKNLFLSPDAPPFTLAEIWPRLQALTLYGSDIFVLDNDQTRSLWGKRSGFDPAGLDYLIERSKGYYDRRECDRTPRKGDHVAILGRRIAVVEHVDSKWIQAAVWNKRTLRIAREYIRWDNRNMRWETSPSACVETNGKATAK